MLSVNNISKSFGSVHAVEDLSFELKKGEIVGLLGPNGAGKTTTMRLISGFLFPEKGEISLDGISVLEDPTLVQKRVGYLPESNPLYREMLVSDILSYSAQLKGLSNEDAKKSFDFVVPSVGIEDVYYKQISHLSKGFRQRVGMALALLNNPDLLILDEPTEGLDPNQRREIRLLIKKLAKEHTVMVSTHVMQEVEALCSRVIVINKGKKVADGSVAELSRGKKSERVIKAVIEGNKISVSLKELTGVSDLKLEKVSGKKYDATIVIDANTDVQPQLSKMAAKNDWILWHLSEEKQQLEDIFKELTS